MPPCEIDKLLIILVLVTGIVVSSAQADFESAATAYRNNDFNAAFQEFLPLAQSGDPRAQTIIAMMYKYGESVDRDHQQAFKWYLAAAEQGYATAQYSLARLYESGKGINPDPEKALYWFAQSAQQGSQVAKQRATELGETNKAASPRLNNPQGWSREWNFKLPEKIQHAAGASASDSRSSDTGAYRVQLGAMKSLAAANHLWVITSEPNQDLFQGLQSYIATSSINKGGVYRVQAGPFDSLKQARYFCSALVRRGIETGCLPIKSIPEHD